MVDWSLNAYGEGRSFLCNRDFMNAWRAEDNRIYLSLKKEAKAAIALQV